MLFFRNAALALLILVILPACRSNFWSLDIGEEDADISSNSQEIATPTQTETQTDATEATTEISPTVETNDETISGETIATSDDTAIEISSSDAFAADAGVVTETSSATVTATQTKRHRRRRTATVTATSSSSSSTATATATATAAAAAVTIDLTASLPANATTADCEISGGALQIQRLSSTSFADSCSVTFAITNDDVSGRMISVDGDRVNLFDHESFDGLTATDVLLYNAATTANDAAEATSAWFSSATSPSRKPTLTDGTATLTKYGNLKQFFKIRPGAELELTFSSDASKVGDQVLYLGTTFYDQNFKTLNFYNPIQDATATGVGNFINYDADDGDFTDTLKIKVIDCDDHKIYTAGDGVGTTDVSFNFCENNGTAMTNADGTAYTEDDITYASIQFAVSWSATANGTTDLKWAKLHDSEDIQFEVLDSGGNVLAEGQGATTFYVPAVDGAASLKLTLSTLKNSASPQIRLLTYGEAVPLAVTVGATTFSSSQPRLSGLDNFGPRSEYADGSVAQRTLCIDPFTDETIACSTLATRYKASSRRHGLYSTYLTATLNGSDYDFSFNEDGEVFLKRLLEMDATGCRINILLVKPTGFMYNSPTDSKSWAVSTAPDDLTDPSGTRTGEDQGAYISEKFARFAAEYFTGTKSYTFQYVDAGTTVTLPKIDEWEIFNEDNITETTWAGWGAWGSIEDDTEADEVAHKSANIMNAMAAAIKEKISDAKVAYASFAAHYGPVFNTDDIELIAQYIDPTVFGINHFHPYVNNDPIHGAEDLVKERWEAAKESLAKYDMDDYQLDIGEYGFTREIYDPACVYSSTTGIYEKTSTPNLVWSRGYGETELSKLLSRQTITLLSLPASGVKPYGQYTGEAQSWGKNINADGSGGFECWRSFPSINFWYYERVEGTGILSGNDEATTYTLTATGKVHTVISKYLSESSPKETTTTVSLDTNEFLNVNAFGVSDGTIIAMSWYRAYDFVYDFMDYVSGVKDDGSTAVKVFDVTPSVSFTSATLISLTDGSETSLTVESGVVKSVPVGALPVLVKLQ